MGGFGGGICKCEDQIYGIRGRRSKGSRPMSLDAAIIAESWVLVDMGMSYRLVRRWIRRDGERKGGISL
jgi:hypothetical protein